MTGMIKQVCRGWTIAKSKTRVKTCPVSSFASPHFLRLHDLHDPDFARGKVSYRGKVLTVTAGNILNFLFS